jgi:hypothetical protein
MPETTSPSPLSSVMPRLSSGPSTAFRFHHEAFDVGPSAQVTAAAHHVLGLGHFDDAAADIAIRFTDRLHHLHQRHTKGAQLDRIDHHLILLDETADAGHLGHARSLGQLVADEPVLDGAQLGQRFVLGQHRVLIDPADTRGVRPQLRRDALGQSACSEVEVFEDARTRPVDIGAILKNHIDKRGAEEGEASNHLGFRHREHGRGQRIGDLVLDHLRRLSRHLGVDDHLHVGQVGQSVQRRLEHGMNAGQGDENRGDDDKELVPRRPADQGTQHLSGPCALVRRQPAQDSSLPSRPCG